MEGIYPIIIGGDKAGELSCAREGLFTAFEAECRNPEPGAVFRLSVYGDAEGYLGVMEPRGDGLYLRRRLSRAQMADFPKVIAFGGASGQSLKPPEAETAEEPEPEPEPELEPAPEPGAEPEAPPADDGMQQTDTLWRRLPGGYLMTGTETEGYIAVPAGTPRVPSKRAVSRRTIEGSDYYIFSLKNGKIT